MRLFFLTITTPMIIVLCYVPRLL